jgi:nucleoside-diphosphate-sugar epimerase
MWLITGASTQLGSWAASALRTSGTPIRLQDSVGLAPDALASVEAGTFVRCELGSGDEMQQLLQGVTAVLHVVPYHCRYSSEEGLIAGVGWLDECTRRTYNLFAAAAASPSCTRVLMVPWTRDAKSGGPAPPAALGLEII